MAPAGSAGTTQAEEGETYNVDDFVGLVLSAFPEVATEEAACIGELVVSDLSIDALSLMFGDPNAPERASPAEEAILDSAIDRCIDPAVAVDAVANWSQRLVTGESPGSMLLRPLPYETLRCIDEELGDVDPGSAFFDMYRRPADFLSRVGAAVGVCIGSQLSEEWLTRWAEEYGKPHVVRADEFVWQPIDPVGSRCLREVLVDKDRPERMAAAIEQLILAASADQVDHRLADVREASSECGLPMSRNYGR